MNEAHPHFSMREKKALFESTKTGRAGLFLRIIYHTFQSEHKQTLFFLHEGSSLRKNMSINEGKLQNNLGVL